MTRLIRDAAERIVRSVVLPVFAPCLTRESDLVEAYRELLPDVERELGSLVAKIDRERQRVGREVGHDVE